MIINHALESVEGFWRRSGIIRYENAMIYGDKKCYSVDDFDTLDDELSYMKRTHLCHTRTREYNTKGRRYPKRIQYYDYTTLSGFPGPALYEKKT